MKEEINSTRSGLMRVGRRARVPFLSVLALCFKPAAYGPAMEWLLSGQWSQAVWIGVFLTACVLGSVVPAEVVWQLVDVFTALMALPNLMALLVLSPQALSLLVEYLEQGRCKVKSLSK